jgi:hypothetical protein
MVPGDAFKVLFLKVAINESQPIWAVGFPKIAFGISTTWNNLEY